MASAAQYLPLLFMVIASSVAIPGINLFDSANTTKYVDDICSTNVSCRAHAQLCYRRLDIARTLLENRNGSKSATQKCARQRDQMNTCSVEVQLNVTWRNLTGSDCNCVGIVNPIWDWGLFRRIPFHPRCPPWYPGLDNPLHAGDNSWEDVAGWPHHFGLMRFDRRPCCPHHHHHHHYHRYRWCRTCHHQPPQCSCEEDRVASYVGRLQTSNPGLYQNITLCSLRQEGVLLSNSTVNRSLFTSWVTAAFAVQPNVSVAVVAAVQSCPNELSSFMECWGKACVEAGP